MVQHPLFCSMPMAHNKFTNCKVFSWPNRKICTCSQVLPKCRTYPRSLWGWSLPILIVVRIVILLLILVAVLVVALLVVLLLVHFEANVEALIVALVVVLVVILVDVLVVVLIVVVDDEKVQKIPSNFNHTNKDLMRMIHNIWGAILAHHPPFLLNANGPE